VLSLDATIVLLTPVVFGTAMRLRTAPRPHVYACSHLANTASLLLPVSNLTNLLAFHSSGVSFARFAALMAAPWLVGLAGEWAVLANLVNNLPATLILLPATAAAGPGAVLAMLIGVNVGPNLTYVGSLATLLWRRVLHAHDAPPELGEFVRLGALTVPAIL